MLRKLFLLLGLIAVTAAVSTAQVLDLGNRVALKVSSADNSDPWGLLEADDETDLKKAAGAKASVIVNMAAEERSAFGLINIKRVEKGLPPLIWNESLAAVARLHSQNMAEFRFFSHRGLDNSLVSDRGDLLNIGKWRAIGENIAFNRGYEDPAVKAVELWLGSPTHRQNMFDPNWKESGLGVAKAQDGSIYFTQVFLLRK